MDYRFLGRESSLILASLLALALAGCSGGSSSAFPNTATPTLPDVFELDQEFGGAGEIITFRATGISSDPADLRVEFADFTQTVLLDGVIIDVRDTGDQPGVGTIWGVDVMVPGGVRSGSVSLFSTGIFFGGFGFEAAPEVVGIVVGQSGAIGAVTRDNSGTIFPTSVVLYGYNLAPGVTSVQIEDGVGSFTSPGLTFGPPGGAGFSIPSGMDALQVELPTTLSAFTCETVRLSFECTSVLGAGLIQTSATVEAPFSTLGSGALVTDAEISGFFSGVSVPPGVRRGEIPIDYAFLMDPAAARFAVVAEYQDPADSTGNTWLPCSAVPGSDLGDRLPGDRAESPGGALIGLGSAQRFLWDSAADLPGVGGDPIVTRIRLRATDPQPPVPGLCPSGEWLSARLVIDNDAPATGSVLEEFDDTTQLDPAGGSANWFAGTLSAPTGGGSPTPQWGFGSALVTLSTGRSYLFDTDLGTLSDVTDAVPVDLLPANPGAPFDEFHFRALTVEAGATVSVVGAAPLVIRCSGNGLDATLALSLRSDLSVDGFDAIPGTDTDSGIGGGGGPGGSRGGDGAQIQVSGEDVLNLTPGTTGVGGGGLFGRSTTYVQSPGSTSLPRAGGGGGGGGAVAGEGGVNPLDPSLTPIADSGAGGAARGDETLVLPVGGSGGGGGGACAIRVSTTIILTPKQGGGGGGGGGAIEIAVRGRAELHAGLFARGGAGSPGSTGAQSGPGGGGGGGTIAVRTTGDLQLFDTAEVSVDGGAGAVTQAGPAGVRGGDGAVGTVRLESNGSLILPAPLPPGLSGANLTTDLFRRSQMTLSRARSRPYRLRTDDGRAVALPTLFGSPLIVDAPGVSPTLTEVIVLYEGAPADPENPALPGEFRGLVGDPSLLDRSTEFVRARWFLYSSPGALSAVERWTLPYSH